MIYIFILVCTLHQHTPCNPDMSRHMKQFHVQMENEVLEISSNCRLLFQVYTILFLDDTLVRSMELRNPKYFISTRVTHYRHRVYSCCIFCHIFPHFLAPSVFTLLSIQHIFFAWFRNKVDKRVVQKVFRWCSKREHFCHMYWNRSISLIIYWKCYICIILPWRFYFFFLFFLVLIFIK